MESRRSARVATPFLVAIEGFDPEPVARHGDISATGIHFSTDRDVGAVGTVHWLDVVSVDVARRVHVMAYVVRAVSHLDEGNRRAYRVAFEFMPESETTVQVLQELVRHVLSVRTEGEAPQLLARVDAIIGGAGGQLAAVRQLTVRAMTLETTWAVNAGERVVVDITAPGRTRRIRLEGRAKSVHARDRERWDIEVEVQREMERPYRPTGPGLETDAPTPLDELIAALIEPTGASSRGEREHLSGDISRIGLTTLCSLFDIDRMTGKLVVRRGDDHAVIWVRNGQLVDVDPLAAAATHRKRISRILEWEDGTFDFSLEPVDREDHVKLSTTALLLDLAREADEASGDA